MKRTFIEILFCPPVFIGCFCLTRCSLCFWRSASGRLNRQSFCELTMWRQPADCSGSTPPWPERSCLVAARSCTFLPTPPLSWWILDGQTEELSEEELGENQGEARGKMESDGRATRLPISTVLKAIQFQVLLVHTGHYQGSSIGTHCCRGC